MDFYWSDPTRQEWDNMLTTAEILQQGDPKQREMVVHWVRSFPFSFLSDRSYVIGRKEFELDGVLYGITKVIKYPHDAGRLVRTDNYWSMWSCAPCACPFGTGAAMLRACEAVSTVPWHILCSEGNATLAAHVPLLLYTAARDHTSCSVAECATRCQWLS
jgi:hypothetical protein